MKKHAVSLCLILGCAILVSSGCAKNEMVKKDEPVVPAATAAVKQPSKPESAKEQIAKAEAAKGQAVKKVMEKSNELQPIPNAGELKAALEKIYFDFDSANLSQEARDILAKNAELMKNEKAIKVQIEGNCDERGSEEYNLALGEKRAKAAEKYLVTMGVAADRISTISYGKEKPADTGHDGAAWAKNRRDEFVITSK
ncbi:peptidoglycan-associated lipoprotein Pal [Geobacter pelophilus]|uniref:Peptidoglycan-associated lipoprotein n=1 Tax=Geoanaerobacter pelophilus TaxID=60036 RepID=A0AAW4L1B7_9BACT|nr:peptidoglycan-associated lipoprotein Pal [Geoanaerobacter pelophilus]MBT0663600.1 peptidoglycan-associated lipoprotein Pal [Geoanaerobacter pelophilus]